jgi:hypothetical protein
MRFGILLFAWAIGLGSAAKAELVSLYTFDGTAKNAVGGAPDGWVAGVGKYVAGKLGKALVFDGSTCVDTTPIGLPTTRGGLQSGSLSFWIATTTSEPEPVIGTANTGNGQSFALELNSNAAGKKALGSFRMFIRAPEDKDGVFFFAVERPSTWRDGNWHQIVITWDLTTGSRGTGTATAFVDGAAEHVTVALNTVASILAFGDWNNPMRIGDWERGKPLPPFLHGSLDDVAVWDHQLGSAQVKALYRLATNRVLKYNAKDVQNLLGIFAGGQGTQGITGDGKLWKYVDGLSGSSGDIVNHDSALVLDRNGHGVAAVTEPGTARFENTR